MSEKKKKKITPHLHYAESRLLRTTKLPLLSKLKFRIPFACISAIYQGASVQAVLLYTVVTPCFP